jgi:hypothetical protein
MVRLICRPLLILLVAASCDATTSSPQTAADYERKARSYDATADSIEHECWKARRHELTVDDPMWCWKGADVRFLEANRHAAAENRAEAARLRSQTAQTAQTARR